ncbi:sigma-70 family RNA polymerase sigma factor [Kutzneria kofuensis]|uniref:RNA polymerase sigma factor (Sigma-70 family) n=1 Tax=Kutzneria kofuensis TaxID=103725 RepID=A0A7W9KD80_9PSEU|nr:sigma-70 family RNA polymerase sigma factor [Kutzneria kofuensis]MBB5889654.1 RNA polymerase sigma factor (sigma-70 family) [Kutzneria kofuensis]
MSDDWDLVIAARKGRADALDELVATYLPLVYNIVGRAMAGHPDMDDAVQDTMLAALDGLPDLEDPAHFRSWLVVMAMREVRKRRRTGEGFPAVRPDDVADPGADFVDLTIDRLHLVDQRRDLVEATRWLEDDERELLSLWWLEAAGRLTRAEVAAGLGLTPQHTAVRVQRMKAKLDAARMVVRALRVRCPELAHLTAEWDGRPSPLWRKRIARHVRDCGRCLRDDLMPAERLLLGIPLVPIPPDFGAVPTSSPPAPRRWWQHAATKPLVAAAAAVAVLAAVLVPKPTEPEPIAVAAPITTTSTTVTTTTTTTTTATTTTTTKAAASTRAVPQQKPAQTSARKGVSAWAFDGVTASLKDVGAAWFYNWDANHNTIPAPPGVEYVPMIWGAKSVTADTLAQVRKQGTELLGFNEPDLAQQANMTPAQALDLWPQLQATGMRLGSPAVAFGGDTPGGWLDQFMSGAGSKGYRVDFITLHWYGSDFGAAAVGQLKSYLQAVHDRYHKPVWLTEFALINFGGAPKFPTQAQQAAFVTNAAAMLDSLPYLERYAWFALPSQGEDTGLYEPGAQPTQVGLAYRAAA